MKDWRIEEMTGYKPKTTFYLDLGIAERFGLNAIRETFREVFQTWSDNVEYITEFTMALNYKIWEHYGHDDRKCELYDELWRKADDWCCEHLTGDDLSYYFRTTD